MNHLDPIHYTYEDTAAWENKRYLSYIIAYSRTHTTVLNRLINTFYSSVACIGLDIQVSEIKENKELTLTIFI